MSRTKILNLKYLSFSILLLCLVSISENLSLTNKIFWATLVVISLFLFNLKFNYKNILTGLYALGLLYLQFTFDRYIFSEEFFIHCLGVLLIVKYAEINTKNNELSFCLICMIISITSLINGQDILSSVLALSIIILSVVNLYLIQQKEVMDFNFKNVLRINNELNLELNQQHNFSNFPFYWINQINYKKVKSGKIVYNLVEGPYCWSTPSVCITAEGLTVKKVNNYLIHYKK